MKVSVFIATSLDGFIARTDGGIDWLMNAGTPGDSEDYGYKKFFDSVDCMVMGRNSFDMVNTFPDWPYGDKKMIVLSNSLKQIPTDHPGNIELYSGSPTKLVETLRDEGYQRLYIDGGKTVQSFLNENLITDLTINKIPIILGEGLPLFGKTRHDIKLTHIKTDTYPSGFVMSTYEVD